MGFPPARSGDDPAMLRRVGLTPAFGTGGEAAVHPTPPLAGDRTSNARVAVPATCAAEGAKVLREDIVDRPQPTRCVDVHVLSVPHAADPGAPYTGLAIWCIIEIAWQLGGL